MNYGRARGFSSVLESSLAELANYDNSVIEYLSIETVRDATPEQYYIILSTASRSDKDEETKSTTLW